MNTSRIAAVLGGMFIVTGCSSTGNAAPVTVTSTVTHTKTSVVTATVAARPNTAPAISRTLTIEPYRTHSCDLLTSDQQAAHGLPQQSGGTGSDCDWKAINPNHTVTVSVLPGGDYFTKVYQQSNEASPNGGKLWEIFEPITVGVAQPAVVLGPHSERFNCEVVVGTASKDSIVVIVVAEDKAKDSCPDAVDLAGKVIGNLHG